MNRPQRRLFALDSLGEDGWLNVMGLHGYAPRALPRPRALHEALFPYTDALRPSFTTSTSSEVPLLHIAYLPVDFIGREEIRTRWCIA